MHFITNNTITKQNFIIFIIFIVSMFDNVVYIINAQIISPRIVGGTIVTDINKYPFYAFPAGTYSCGATVVHKDILLTAAHCNIAFIQAGVLIGGNTIDGQYSTYYEVIKTIIHPKYNKNNYLNDILLIKINGIIPEPYVTLNYNNSLPYDNDKLSVIGYGNTEEGGTYSPELMTVDFFKVNYEECKNYFSDSINIQDDIMLCSGGIIEGGKDSCQGDSGGPIFMEGTNIQVGIVSFGDGCAKPNVPSVNERVSAYQEWIESEICKLSNDPPSSCSSKPTIITKIPKKIIENNNDEKPTKDNAAATAHTNKEKEDVNHKDNKKQEELDNNTNHSKFSINSHEKGQLHHLLNQVNDSIEDESNRLVTLVDNNISPIATLSPTDTISLFEETNVIVDDQQSNWLNKELNTDITNTNHHSLVIEHLGQLVPNTLCIELESTCVSDIDCCNNEDGKVRCSIIKNMNIRSASSKKCTIV